MNLKYINIGALMMVIATNTLGSEITVTGIDEQRRGNIIVFVFSESGFPKKHDKALQQKTEKVKGDTMQFLFDIEEEEVAIKVLHDEDENGRVNKNWTGIYPAEGLGFSNKQKVSLTGAPIYKRSKVSNAELNTGLTIEMIYP